MRIIDAWPPNIEEISAVIPAARTMKGVMFTYGDAVYFPGGRGILTPELRSHEAIHSQRQGSNPDAWWERYLTDPSFRLEEEIVAHRAEYGTFCERHKERELRSRFLRMIASRLSSPLYGRMINEIEARQRISE